MKHLKTGWKRGTVAALVAVAMTIVVSGCTPRMMGVNYAGEKLERDRSVAAHVGYYLLSRLLDTVDMITVNVGFGPAAHAEIHVTQAARLGIGGLMLASVGTSSAPREAGFFLRGVGELALLPWHAQAVYWEEYLSTGTDYSLTAVELRTPGQQLYRRKVDYWSVGASGGLLVVGGQLELHPLQMADWLLGWFTVDFLNDDL